MPQAVRLQLGPELVCYARFVVHEEWPRMEAGEKPEEVSPWGVAMFRSLKTTEPRTASEQSAYDKWLDHTADREEARRDRIHGAVGVIPGPLWVVLFFITAAIFLYMLLFADSGERAFVQATMVGSVMAAITVILLLIGFLNQPFRQGYGGLRSGAMERTLRVLDQERRVFAEGGRLPCDPGGRPLR
jgi:hypothetical protein